MILTLPYAGVASIMEHSKYRYYCIGQLPKQSLASLSHYITHGK